MKHHLTCGGTVFEGWFQYFTMLVPSEAPTRTVTVAPPWGVTRPHDTDLLVPEYEGEFGANAPFAVSRMRGAIRDDVWVYRWHVLYNLTKIEPFNPGPNDWRAIRRHERAHCRGFGHYEGTPETNPCYYPTVQITGT